MRETNQVNMELIPSLVGEIILCSKEPNKKTRDASFELLITMAQTLEQTQPEGLMTMLQIVLAGLAGRTSHMRSASLVSISRLIFEFGRSRPEITTIMPELLKTIILLLHEKAKEVIKSVIGFLKLSIAIIPMHQLEGFLPDMIQGLLLWIGDSKNRFKAKIRIIMIKLCRKFGYDKVMQHVPEKDRKLITHIKKEKRKADRQREQAKASYSEKASFDQLMDSDDEDDLDDETMIRENIDDDDMMDFMDSTAIKNVVSKNHHTPEESALDFSKDGRLIVPDDAVNPMTDKDDDDPEDVSKLRDDVLQEMKKMGMQQTNNQNNERVEKRKRKVHAAGFGSEYRAKKAGGDVKTKGKLDPYAYIPLDPRLMAKRNRHNAVKRYSGVVRRKGKGSKEQ